VIIFPALLLATHEPYVLPWQVSSTEFILFDGKRFSKSNKIGVWVDDALKVAPGEYWRYVLIAIRPEARDANFTWRDFETHVNSELNDVLGNFVHRTLSFVNSYLDGIVPEPGVLDQKDETIKKEIEEAPSKIAAMLDDFQLREGLAQIIELARAGNQYLSEREPWHLIKTDRSKTATTLYFATQLVGCLAILISPVLPETARGIGEQLNLGTNSTENWWDAGKLRVEAGHKIGKPVPLFHKVRVANS
jgi:methionyl-tRNA synthetase